MESLLKYIYQRFKANPVMVLVFSICFVAVPIMAGVIYRDISADKKMCISQSKTKDSILIQIMYEHGKSSGYIDAIKKIDSLK